MLLLDEPDAHLEILRQRQTYQLITETATKSGNQIIIASHSEVLLNEAAGKDTVVAFVGAPHRMGDRGSHVLKALREIGFEQYLQAKQTGWVLYLEGSTDLAILQAFAHRLRHEGAIRALDRVFVHYVGNQLPKAHAHYHGLREAMPNLRGIAILDECASTQPDDGLECLAWARREIENYLCSRATLEGYVKSTAEQESMGPLFIPSEADRRLRAMRKAITEVERAMVTLGKGSPWDANAKVSDDFLSPLFSAYFKNLGFPNLMNKGNFHELAKHVLEGEIAPEIKAKLDAIADVATASESAEEAS